MPHPGFQLDAGYSFAESNGLTTEAAQIRSHRVHGSIGRPAAVRKGYLVKLFEERHLDAQFAALHWPLRNTDAGVRRRAYFIEMAELNERALRGDPPGPGPEPDGSEDTESGMFPLEAHLRDYIAANIGRLQIGTGRLGLYQGKGVEYRTDVGPIDILASDTEGNFVVFELKVNRGPDKTLGQLARYMGWVKTALAHDKNVTGVIVAHSIEEKLRYAATVVPNVHLLEYQIAFSLRPVDPISASQLPLQVIDLSA